MKQEEIPATGHSYGEWYETKSATCEETGAERRDCGNCDHYETREIMALGHSKVSHEAKAPTCTEIGWKAYETCMRCDYSTYEEIPAMGHSFGEWVAEGRKQVRVCECGEQKVQRISPVFVGVAVVILLAAGTVTFLWYKKKRCGK